MHGPHAFELSLLRYVYNHQLYCRGLWIECSKNHWTDPPLVFHLPQSISAHSKITPSKSSKHLGPFWQEQIAEFQLLRAQKAGQGWAYDNRYITSYPACTTTSTSCVSPLTQFHTPLPLLSTPPLCIYRGLRAIQNRQSSHTWLSGSAPLVCKHW